MRGADAVRASNAGFGRRRGFTLIELMIVVAVVGVLSVVAYAGYHKFVVASHLTEAQNVLAGLKMREEGYKAEKGKYLTLSTSLAANQGPFPTLYPHCASGVSAPGAFSVAWGAACPSSCCANDFAKLHVEVNAPTFYGFSAVADASSVPTVSMNGAAIVWPSPVGSWFVATAVGDTDGNGTFSTVVVSSFDNEARIDNYGE